MQHSAVLHIYNTDTQFKCYSYGKFQPLDDCVNYLFLFCVVEEATPVSKAVTQGHPFLFNETLEALDGAAVGVQQQLSQAAHHSCQVPRISFYSNKSQLSCS